MWEPFTEKPEPLRAPSVRGWLWPGAPAPMNVAWLAARTSESVAMTLAGLGEPVLGPDLLRLGLATEVVADDQVLVGANLGLDMVAGAVNYAPYVAFVCESEPDKSIMQILAAGTTFGIGGKASNPPAPEI